MLLTPTGNAVFVANINPYSPRGSQSGHDLEL